MIFKGDLVLMGPPAYLDRTHSVWDWKHLNHLWANTFAHINGSNYHLIILYSSCYLDVWSCYCE